MPTITNPEAAAVQSSIQRLEWAIGRARQRAIDAEYYKQKSRTP